MTEFATVLTERRQFDAEFLARTLGRPATGWGIVAENQSEPEARRTAEALQTAGLKAVTVPQDLLATPRPPTVVATAVLQSRAAALFEPSGAPHEIRAPALIACGLIKRAVTKTISEQKDIGLGEKALQIGLMIASGLPLRQAALRRTVETTVEQAEVCGVLDIFQPRPTLRLRIDAAEFDFSCLGQNKTYAAADNLRTLCRELGKIFPGAARNRGAAAAAEDRFPAEARYSSPQDLEAECRWLLTLEMLKI